MKTINESLAYTYLDLYIWGNTKIRHLLRRRGPAAFAVYVAFLCLIYRTRWYIKFDEEILLDVADMTRCDYDFVKQSFNDCLDLGLFSRELYERERVITSHGIQTHYEAVCCRLRRKARVSGPYCLLTEDEKNEIKSENSKTKFQDDKNEEDKTENDTLKTNIDEDMAKNDTFLPTNKNKSKSKINLKENYYSFLTPEEEQQEELDFLYQLFFRNYPRPNLELKKFIEWNTRPGHSDIWAQTPHDSRQSALNHWKQKPKQEPRFNKENFLVGWKPIVDKMIELCSPASVIRDALADDLTIEINRDGVLIISCTTNLRDYIKSNLADFRVLIRSCEKLLGCSHSDFIGK